MSCFTQKEDDSENSFTARPWFTSDAFTAFREGFGAPAGGRLLDKTPTC
jgi:hypothetical protein